jgi:bacterioferritin-associated ferredoxin
MIVCVCNRLNDTKIRGAIAQGAASSDQADGRSGEHDFAQLVQESGSMVEPLRDKSYFDRVFVDWGALTWPNGFDLDPINLHDTMQAAGELHRQAAE